MRSGKHTQARLPDGVFPTACSRSGSARTPPDYERISALQPDIKTIEDLSLNAWPSHQIEIYDGWLLRFSYFYTHRTNCVEQIGPSALPISDKIAYCENAYRRWGTPAIFKISPLLDPSFDRHLAARGYVTEHTVHNMTLDIASGMPDGSAASGLYRPARDLPADSSGSGDLPEKDLAVTTSPFISDAWINALFALKKTTNIMHRQVVPSMYRAIPKETVAASVSDRGRIIATGLGILDRGCIGIYAIHVHPDYRRKHIAEKICRALLSEGRGRGAETAYLQVVADNAPAIALYRRLGFAPLYDDWFRVKVLAD